MEAPRSIENVIPVPCKINPFVNLTEAAPGSALLAIALGPTRIIRSSLRMSWQGILLEKHMSSPGERTSASIHAHVVSMFHSSPSRFEYRSLSGEYIAVLSRPRAIMLTPSGNVPDIRLHTSAEFIHCALEEGFVRSVINELDHAAVRPQFRAGIQDKSIQRILGMLMDELEADRPSGRLYVDSLAHALATRYVLPDVGGTRRSEPRAVGLVPRILNRVRGKIEANLDADLSLESLAEESGYSRAHFLRMFRTATGLTPHQYVLDLRLRRAQEGLRQTGSSIIDVAVSCGFSSQSHMTSVFRRRFEMTPGEFRRNALDRTQLSYVNAVSVKAI
jgi:AraC family transcriptional regulator